MTSRYYNTNYYSSTSYASPYRSSRSPKSYPMKSYGAPFDYYYPSQERTKPSKKSKKSPKQSSPKGGRARPPRSPILGRRRPSGQWKQKKHQMHEEETKDPEITKKESKGKYAQESIEAQLVQKTLESYKKGVFYHHDPEQRKEDISDEEMEENGHPINNKLNNNNNNNNDAEEEEEDDDDHKQYMLTRIGSRQRQRQHNNQINNNINNNNMHIEPRDEIFDDMPRPVPPNYEQRISKSNGSNKSNEEEDEKQQKRSKTKLTSTRKQSSSRKRRKSSKQATVTVSPRAQRMPPYGRAMMGPDYYYSPSLGMMGYQAQPAYDPYGRPYDAQPPQYAPDYGYAMSFGSGRRAERGMTGDDGAWYPYPDVIDQEQYNKFITPKSKKRTSGSSKEVVSANVDLTTPIVDKEKKREKKADDEKTPPLNISPGRRVNKIQKQLEYYFSQQNMETDDFLRKYIDEEGYVSAEILVNFHRMKTLGADKTLVIEAAFHSQFLDVDLKTNSKVRPTKHWKKYAKLNKKSSKTSTKFKSRSKSKKYSTDDQNITSETIEQIVAGIEKQAERREKRRREKEKKRKKAQERNEKEKKAKKEREEKEKKEKEKEEKINASTDTQQSEDAAALIAKDQAEKEKEDDIGDPSHKDMVEID